MNTRDQEILFSSLIDAEIFLRLTLSVALELKILLYVHQTRQSKPKTIKQVEKT